MAQRGGTFLLRRAGREQKSGLTPGHPGDPAPEKICSDTGFCCAQFRVSPACLSLLLMGKESAIVRRPRAPLSLLHSRGDVKVGRGNPTGQTGAGRAVPAMLHVCWPAHKARRDAQGPTGAEHHLRGQELSFPLARCPGRAGAGQDGCSSRQLGGNVEGVFLYLSPGVISEISRRVGVRQDCAKNSCWETAAGRDRGRRPCQPQGCLQCPLSPHLDTC